MNGKDLRNLEIQYTAEYYNDITGGIAVLILWLLPGGLYGCGQASGMGGKYTLYFFAWIAATLYGMPSLSWYGICWLGGMVTFWTSYYYWYQKNRAPTTEEPKEITLTINL